MLQRLIPFVFIIFCNIHCTETIAEAAKTTIELLEIIDKGFIKESLLVDSIKIINTGKADLKIAQVEPGCSCSVSSCDSFPIQAGRSSFIHFSINLSDTGYFQKNFVIEANTDSVFHVVNVRGHFNPI